MLSLTCWGSLYWEWGHFEIYASMCDLAFAFQFTELFDFLMGAGTLILGGFGSWLSWLLEWLK